MESWKKLYVNFWPPPTPPRDENCLEVTPGCKLYVLRYQAKKEIPKSAQFFNSYLEKVSRFKISIKKESALRAFFLSWVARHADLTPQGYFSDNSHL